MGGIANSMHLPTTMNPEEVFVTDTKRNTLIDAFIRHYFLKKGLM
jgi:hypothetical protein